jgi:hypothetical protein
VETPVGALRWPAVVPLGERAPCVRAHERPGIWRDRPGLKCVENRERIRRTEHLTLREQIVGLVAQATTPAPA